MRNTLLLFAVLFATVAYSQPNNIKFTVGIAFTEGPPTFKPGATGARWAVDTVTYILYESLNPSTNQWVSKGGMVGEVVGCSAPAYTPNKHQTTYITNQCSPPKLFKWNGAAWEEIAGAGGGGTVYSDNTIDGDGSLGSPLKIGQNGALSGQEFSWNGTGWIPSWGNPYIYVTANSSVASSVNTVLIGTISSNITLGLPSCNAANDQKTFEFKKNGSDAFGVTIDPSSTETFHDGAATKTIYSNLNLNCVCRFSGGTGTWFYTQ